MAGGGRSAGRRSGRSLQPDGSGCGLFAVLGTGGGLFGASRPAGAPIPIQSVAIQPIAGAFDVSGAVPPSSWYGTLLKGTVNFSPRTTWLELAAWLAYVVPVLTLFVRRVRPKGPSASDSSPSARGAATAPPTGATLSTAPSAS